MHVLATDRLGNVDSLNLFHLAALLLNICILNEKKLSLSEISI